MEYKVGVSGNRSRHLRTGTLEDAGHPFRVGQSAGRQRLHFVLQIVRHAADSRLDAIDQQVRCAAVTIVRLSYAAAVGTIMPGRLRT